MLQKRQRQIIFLMVMTLLAQVYCNGQNGGIKPSFTLLTYGLPDFKKQNSENVIALKWGIKFVAVAGCGVSEELEDSVAKHNNKVELLIKKKYGENWSEKFYAEVDAEYEIEKTIADLLNNLDYIQKREADMEKEGNGLQYKMTPIPNTNKYKVWAQGWAKLNGHNEWVTYYKLLVDYHTKKNKLLNDKITKE